MWLLLVGLSRGAEPTVSVGSDGAVRGSVTIQASTDAVRAVMSNPELTASIDGGSQVTSSQDGSCRLIHYTVPNPFMSIEYTARGCPTRDGMVYTLVESDDLKRFTSSWTVSDVGEGRAKLEYSVLTVPTMPVPQRIISNQTSASVERFLERISAHLEARR